MRHRRSPGQRAYEALRIAVLHGDLPAGRIDIQQIADRLGVSPTPVREALARMASEQLIVFAPGHGYAIECLSAKALYDLYVWTDRVARLALDLSREHGARHVTRPDIAAAPCTTPTSASDYARDVATFFDEVAHASCNGEFISKIADSNARLFRVRTVEWNALTETQEELCRLVLLWRADRSDELNAKIRDFHLRRIEHCEDIARALSRVEASQAC